MTLRLRISSRQKDELGDGARREFVACGGTIGRALDNDWVLPDPKRFISSRHALIDFQAGTYYLVDTSRNGVFINGSDAAVGRGHPQRLFDGDTLRLGEYEVAIEVTADDAKLADDGMRDSAVRAQLVPIDESMEFKLVDESKLRAFDFDALEKMTKPDPDNPPLGPVAQPAAETPAPPRSAVRPPKPPTAMNHAVETLCRSAGLKSGDLQGRNPEEVLENAGSLLRELLLGLTELLQYRAQLKESLQLPETASQSTPGNPLRVSRNVGELLRHMLGENSEAYLPPDLAVQAAFLDIRNHQQALHKAMIHAIADFSGRLEPNELRSAFDRSINRTGLLAGANRLKYWELYEQTYLAITDQGDGDALPRVLREELSKAYQQELNSQREEGLRA